MDSLIKIFNWLCCGCIGRNTDNDVTTYGSVEPTISIGSHAQTVRIGAFNVQRLSVKKFDDEFVRKNLLKIMSRYDLLLVQEVQDKEKKRIPEFVEDLTKYAGHSYGYVVSDYLGRKTYKEQYLYIYRTDIFNIIDSYHYDDGSEELGEDTFQREPFCVLVKSNKISVKSFAIIGAHLTPQHVPEELDELVNVYEDVKKRWGDVPVILMGDFNADGRHISKKKLSASKMKQDTSFHWLIENLDTTVAKNDYTYDRIIVSGEKFIQCIQKDSIQVFNFDEEYMLQQEETSAISDHYPVEFILGKPRNEEL